MRIKILFLLCSSLLYNKSLIAQDEPTSAPKVSSFSLGSDKLGSIANSVNLFTGDLNLPMNLVSIPGGNGLGVDVSIQYSSANIENIVGTWNLESPTGILGLGWSMPTSQIIVDNKQTGARDDDDFYLIDGGISTILICVANSSGIKTYKTRTYSNSIITYNAALERWDITKEDGTKVIYGDVNSGRSTVQWIVKWGNWIGSSNQGAGQQRQGLVWNVSEIQSIWGQKISYTYTNVEQTVGASGTLFHTEASYLIKINDAWNNEVELLYKNKMAVEYAEPHTESKEPDAYQERYERQYLDRIYVKNNAILVYEVDLRYATHLFGSGNLTKRLLTSVSKVSATGYQQPSFTFDYLISGAMKGALKFVSSGTDGSVNFEYHAAGITLNHSARELNITAPAGYAEPKVKIESDFAVVSWRQMNGSAHDSNPRPVQIYAYSWVGKWKELALGTVGNVKMTDNQQDFQLVTGSDFFAFLRPENGTTTYMLYVWHKDGKTSGGWKQETFFIDLGTHDNTKEQLLTGNNFIAVSNNNGRIVRYVWNGEFWNSSTVNETQGRHFTTTANNYILSHDVSSDPDLITLYHTDELKKWQTSTFSSGINTGTGESFWYTGNSFAFLMAYGLEESVFSWDENYGNFQKIDKGIAYKDYSKVFVIDNTQISIVEDNGTDADKIRNLRFTGIDWVMSGEEALGNSWDSSFGNDYYVWKTIDNSYIRKFNPNVSLWENSQQFPRSTQNPSWSAPPTSGINYFFLEGSIFNRDQNGTWASQLNTPIASGYSLVRSYMGFNYLFNLTQKNVGDPHKYNIQFFRNGQLSAGYEKVNLTPFVYDYSHQYPSTMITPTTIILINDGSSSDFRDVNSMTLHRVVNEKVEDKQIDFPITKVTSQDGTGSYYTSFTYDVPNSTSDPGGTTGLYNIVTTTPGNSTTGSIQSYFYNTLSETELEDTFPDETPSFGITAAKSNYKILTGTIYRSKVINSSAITISESYTVHSFPLTFTYDNLTEVVDITPVPLTLRSVSTIDQQEKVIQYSYNSRNQVNVKKEYSGLISQDSPINYEYKYAWEQYPSCASKNILSPVIQTQRNVPGTTNTYLESAATRWKDWPCSGPNCLHASIPLPFDQYGWKGTNSSTFTAWDVSGSPSTDWIFINKVNSRDVNTGDVLEQQGKAGQVSATLLNEKKQAQIAQVSNASLAQVAFTSFEDAAQGNWIWSDGTIIKELSKTGVQCLTLGTTGLTKSGLTPSQKYTVSFWAKSNGGAVIVDGVGTVNLGSLADWTLFEFEVIDVSTVGIRKNGATEVLLDEVRLHPSNAIMSTTTYHPVYGVTSTTDSNNRTSYIEYDEWGRVKNILDENRNIIKTNTYYTKK